MWPPKKPFWVHCTRTWFQARRLPVDCRSVAEDSIWSWVLWWWNNNFVTSCFDWYPLTWFYRGIRLKKSNILLAAHCIQPKAGTAIYDLLNKRDVLARFGAYNLNDQYEVGHTTLSPYEIHIHKDWNPNVQQYDADIALLKFLKIHFSNHIQPICLWKLYYDPPTSVGTVVGWGQSENKSRSFENIPRKIEVPLLSNEDCWLEDPHHLAISSGRTFCAGLKNGAGICFGDSGSGYFIKIGRYYYLKGIVSSSAYTDVNECDVSRYAIYTDVLKHKHWIQTLLEASDFFNQVSSRKSISSKYLKGKSNSELRHIF